MTDEEKQKTPLQEYIYGQAYVQADIARECGVSPQTLSNLVRGTGRSVSVRLLNKLAKRFSMTFEQLVDLCTNLNCKGLEDFMDIRQTEENQPQDVGVDAAEEVPEIDDVIEEEEEDDSEDKLSAMHRRIQELNSVSKISPDDFQR